MRKPFGVTASAAFALRGSMLMLGFCVVVLLVLVLSPGRGPIPPEAKLGMGLGLGIFGFLGAWGNHHCSWIAANAKLGTHFSPRLRCHTGAYRSGCGSGDFADPGSSNSPAEL